MVTYTLKKLTDVQDSAAQSDLSEVQEARFATEELAAEQTGVSLQKLRAGKRQAFGHRHEVAEEVYVVLAGSGRVKLDEEILDLAKHDALRVAPAVTRQFEAGPDGLEFLVFGARHSGDGEILKDWWSD